MEWCRVKAGESHEKEIKNWCCLFGFQILMSVDSMRQYVAPTASVRTDWVLTDASVTRATRSHGMAKAVWVSVWALVYINQWWEAAIQNCATDLDILICHNDYVKYKGSRKYKGDTEQKKTFKNTKRKANDLKRRSRIRTNAITSTQEPLRFFW